ncbi:MAG: aminotransferase class III-fold pyridoxal phosphate-dependent enzyme, partial [Rhodospirillaceae bacterium]|nr:aminotransferase class III-fold pyridoxal phosphate-dependent enzyme [Rhodospirillaceae bacterium]
VLVPPKGYLERLRAITKKHGILLIFDEVITGFGRLGSSFASEYFGVTPDMFTMAKGLTSGYVPMGAVAASNDIYQAFMDGSPEGIELFHGYTYSAHPLACAAAVATLQVYEEEGLFQRAADMTPYWQEAVHSMKDLPNVIDIRNIGLVAGIELSAREGAAGKRGMEACIKAYEAGLMVRVTGDIIALSPPLILEERHIDQMVEITSNVIRDLD